MAGQIKPDDGPVFPFRHDGGQPKWGGLTSPSGGGLIGGRQAVTMPGKGPDNNGFPMRTNEVPTHGGQIKFPGGGQG